MASSQGPIPHVQPSVIALQLLKISRLGIILPEIQPNPSNATRLMLQSYVS